jgi:hypothetical protein
VNIGLQNVRTGSKRRFKSSQGIFPMVEGETAVSDDAGGSALKKRHETANFLSDLWQV